MRMRERKKYIANMLKGLHFSISHLWQLCQLEMEAQKSGAKKD